MASEQTNTWLMHACTNAFPSEDLMVHEGWPKGMMGDKRAQKLKDRGINNFRQLLQKAVSMNEADFKLEFGGSGALDNRASAFWEVLNTWNQAQLERTGQKIPQTDKWVAWADTHALPAESLSQREGWPDGMLGEIRVAKLESQNITKTSQLLDAALSMSQPEFVEHFGKGGALDNRAAAFYTFLLRSAEHNKYKRGDAVPASATSASPTFLLIAVILLVLALAYKFVA
jgi:hypothetical protein